MKYVFFLIFLAFYSLSPAQIPGGTDIFVVKSSLKKGKLNIETPLNITHRAGYDNQPSFSNDGKLIYYVAVKEDGQADIYAYSFASQLSQQITQTKESEYSPKITPDGNYMSVVRVELDSSQRFWKYPLNGTAPEIICADMDSIGYYNWVDQSSFVFFKITAQPSLWMMNSPFCTETLKASHIGRSLHTAKDGQIYFTQVIDTVPWIVRMNPAKGSIIKVVPCIKGSEDFDFFGADLLLMGQGSQLFSYSIEHGGNWKEIANFEKTGVTNIKRISVSADLSKIAFVNDSGKP